MRLIIFFLLFYKNLILINSQKTWTYDFTDIEIKTTDKNFIDGELEVVRIGRGVFGVTGFIDVKQSVDETFSVAANFYRDKYCNGNYEILPYSVSKMDFPQAMNKFYKEYFMDSLKECAEEAPVFDSFQPPLTKRRMVLNKCKISTDNLPSHVDDGCYWLSMNLHGVVDSSIEMYGVVEKKFK